MKNELTLKQSQLLNAISRSEIKSFIDLAETHISDADLKVLRSTKWTQLNLRKKQLTMVQKAKSFVSHALSYRAKHQNDYDYNRKARRCNHNVDHAKNTAHADDFAETEALAYRGDAGQTRTEKKTISSSQVVDLVTQDQSTETKTVAA